MSKFLRKYWWLIGVTFLLPVIGIYGFLDGKFDSDAAISLISAVFTYYGTIMLSFATVLQNDKITELSTRNAKVDEIRLSNQFHPLIEIESIKDTAEVDLETEKIYKNGFGIVKKICDIKSKTIYIVFINSGNASAYNGVIYDYGYVKSESDKIETPIFDYKKRIITELKEEECCYLEVRFEDNAVFCIDFNFCYQNEYGNKFYNPVKIELVDDAGNRTAQIGIAEQIKGDATIDVKEFYYRPREK